MERNLAVFFGGASVEHEVSVISAVQAMHALPAEAGRVIPVYMPKTGGFYTGEALKQIEAYRDIPALLARCRPVTFVRERSGVTMRTLTAGRFRRPEEVRIDLALPVVHGTNCEDGSLQGFFEVLGLPYAGCGVAASAAGMDKVFFKQIMRENGLPVLPEVWFYARDFAKDEARYVAEIEEKLGYPVIVKPANLGSSVGIAKAEGRDALLRAVREAAGFAPKLLVEKAVTALKEINCAVLGDPVSCEASAGEQPVMTDEILSYTDKYQRGGGKTKQSGMASLSRLIPAPLTDEKRDEITTLACRVFAALGCRGVARIDFLVDAADEDRVYVNEINTIPGSLAFYLWEAAGKPYAELLNDLIELARRGAREREQLQLSYDTNLLATATFGGKQKGGKL